MEYHFVGDIAPLRHRPVMSQVDKEQAHAAKRDDGIHPRQVHHDAKVKESTRQSHGPRVVLELGSIQSRPVGGEYARH